MTWDMLPLGECINVLSGFAFKSALFSASEGMPLIRIRDVTRGRTETYYTGEYVQKFVIKKGDILVGMDGEFNVARWPGPDALMNQRVCKITPDTSHICKEYLYHFLPQQLKMIEDRTPFVTVKHLSARTIKSIETPLPPLSEQKRIAAILDKADGIRRKRKAALDMADEFLRATFLDMFGDPVTNPKGWDVKPLGELAKFIGGGTPPKKVPEYYSGKTCWASSKDIKTEELIDTINHITEEAIDASATKLVPPNIILIVVKSKILMRTVPLALTTKPTCFNQDLKGIQPNDTKTTRYIFRHLKVGEKKLLSLARGVNTEGLTLDHLRNLDIMQPSSNLMERYSDIESSLKACRKDLAIDLAEANTLFASLSQRAFRGEL